MSFDALAPHYRWMEWLCAAGQLQRCRAAQLEAITDPHHVLIYGEGNGRFLLAFCQQFPAAQITCVDASDVMLRLAKERLRRAGVPSDRITFLHVDALTWQPPKAQFDLIVTHFFLDCFTNEELQSLMPLIATAAAPQARWLIGDFHVPDHPLMRLAARAVLASLYFFFRFATKLSASELTPPDDHLREAGFELKSRHDLMLGLLQSSLWRRVE